MNKTILMGRLTRDPEIKYSSSPNPVAITRYNLAVKRPYAKAGQNDTDFINIKALAKRAEFAHQHFKRGMMVSIVGEIQTHRSKKADGSFNYFTDILVQEQYFAESRASYEARQASQPNTSAPGEQGQDQHPPNGFYEIPEGDLDDDDLPF